MIKFTWRLTQIEYEYSIFEGTFFLSKILGKASRRDILENQLSEATKVAPYTEQYKNTIDFKRVKRTIKAISSDSAENVWFVLFEKESGENVLVLFEADEKSLRLIRRSCPRAVAREKIKNTDGDVKIHESEN